MKRALYNPLNLSKGMKWLSGAACFAELARSAACWDARALEDRIKGGAISRDKEDPDNGLQRWLRGELPSDATIDRCRTVLPQARVREWRDHGLWIVLEDATPTVAQILAVLESLGAQTRERVFADQACVPLPVDTRLRAFDEQAIGRIEEGGGIEALLALTAIARHGEASATMRPRSLAAAATVRLFPRVVGASPHLFASWPLLVKRFAERVWRDALYFGESLYQWRYGAVIDELMDASRTARETGVDLPPGSIVARSLRRVAEECAIGSPADVMGMLDRTSRVGG